MRKKTKLNKNEALDKFGTIWNKEKIQALLEKNDEAVYRALIKIYDRQTADEQEYQDTTEYNTIGFTGVDGHILSGFAEYYKKYGKLSEKQMKLARKKMKKYWKQLLDEIRSENPQEFKFAKIN